MFDWWLTSRLCVLEVVRYESFVEGLYLGLYYTDH
jgi:hypothetical protein